ncbi:MAG: PIN domain-containing protein [Anaerolineae bacterium]|nr:PIN domain-containing protein [Anaerolineae bacterium]
MSYTNAARGFQFVDTNVLVYAHDPTAGAKYERARQLVSGLWEAREGCLSVQVLQEFYVTATRRTARLLSPTDAAKVVSSLSFWRVHRPSASHVLAAIDLSQQYCISFWDAMIIVSAARLRCSTLWTEDLNHGQTYDGVRVLNPFATPAA